MNSTWNIDGFANIPFSTSIRCFLALTAHRFPAPAELLKIIIIIYNIPKAIHSSLGLFQLGRKQKLQWRKLLYGHQRRSFRNQCLSVQSITWCCINPIKLETVPERVRHLHHQKWRLYICYCANSLPHQLSFCSSGWVGGTVDYCKDIFFGPSRKNSINIQWNKQKKQVSIQQRDMCISPEHRKPARWPHGTSKPFALLHSPSLADCHYIRLRAASHHTYAALDYATDESDQYLKPHHSKRQWRKQMRFYTQLPQTEVQTKQTNNGRHPCCSPYWPHSTSLAEQVLGETASIMGEWIRQKAARRQRERCWDPEWPAQAALVGQPQPRDPSSFLLGKKARGGRTLGGAACLLE